MDNEQKKLMGVTEQMEKYINHDLELIQEEHENAMQIGKKARDLTYIQLGKTRNNFNMTQTSYTAKFDLKKIQNDEIKESYLKTKEYDRQSSLQKTN